MKKDIKQDIKHKIWEVGSFSLLGILYYWVFTEIINWDEIESKTGYTCLEEKECEGLKKWWSELYKTKNLHDLCQLVSIPVCDHHSFRCS